MIRINMAAEPTNKNNAVLRHAALQFILNNVIYTMCKF